MTTAYLCGPVTNGGNFLSYQIEENRRQFTIVQQKLGADVKVLDPTEIPLPFDAPWVEFMKLTIPMLCEADFMILLPGWERSRGCIIEIFLANTLNIPVIFSDALP